MQSEVARSLTCRQRAAERMCRFGATNPLISVIAPDERTSKHIDSRTPTAACAFRLMVLYVQRQRDAGAVKLFPAVDGHILGIGVAAVGDTVFWEETMGAVRGKDRSTQTT